MKKTIFVGLMLSLAVLLSSCTAFRAENPLNVKCPTCGYQWDYAIPRR